MRMDFSAQPGSKHFMNDVDKSRVSTSLMVLNRKIYRVISHNREYIQPYLHSRTRTPNPHGSLGTHRRLYNEVIHGPFLGSLQQ